MPVPTWTPIPDSMVAPEAPVSSDLMTRLRDQWASVFGFDPTSPTQPPFTLPASTEVASGTLFFQGQAYSTSFTTSEYIISVVSDPVEWLELENIAGAPYGNGSSATEWKMIPHFIDTNNSQVVIAAVNLTLVDVIYSAGAPTGVRIRGCGDSAVGSGSSTMFDVTVPLTNTYTTLVAISGGNLQAKARATSTDVYLQMRHTNPSFQAAIRVPMNRRVFASKA